MIATAAEPVDVENQVNCLLAVDFLDRASQFSRRRVVIILIAAARKRRKRCGALIAASLPTMSLSSMPPTAYPCCLTHSSILALPSNPCSSPEIAANRSVARKGSFPPVPVRLNNLAHSMLTATPEASSSAPGASRLGSITSVARCQNARK